MGSGKTKLQELSNSPSPAEIKLQRNQMIEALLCISPLNGIGVETE